MCSSSVRICYCARDCHTTPKRTRWTAQCKLWFMSVAYASQDMHGFTCEPSHHVWYDLDLSRCSLESVQEIGMNLAGYKKLFNLVSLYGEGRELPDKPCRDHWGIWYPGYCLSIMTIFDVSRSGTVPLNSGMWLRLDEFGSKGLEFR